MSESWGISGSASPSAKGAKRIEKPLGRIREQAGKSRSQFPGAGRGSSAHGILQARMLEWVAMHFSSGSS